jgi:hypothetical protein
MNMYSGVSFYSVSPTSLAVSKVSPSVLLPQDSLSGVVFVSVYQQDRYYHAICMLCSISLVNDEICSLLYGRMKCPVSFDSHR